MPVRSQLESLVGGCSRCRYLHLNCFPGTRNANTDSARSAYRLRHSPLPIAERSIAISVSVCLSVCVCLSVRDHISGTTRPNFTKSVVHVTDMYGRGSVLLWRRSDRLCTSGLWTTSYLLITQGCSTPPPI